MELCQYWLVRYVLGNQCRVSFSYDRQQNQEIITKGKRDQKNPAWSSGRIFLLIFVKMLPDRLRRAPWHHSGQGLHVRLLDGPDGAEVLPQLLPALGT